MLIDLSNNYLFVGQEKGSSQNFETHPGMLVFETPNKPGFGSGQIACLKWSDPEQAKLSNEKEEDAQSNPANSPIRPETLSIDQENKCLIC